MIPRIFHHFNCIEVGFFNHAKGTEIKGKREKFDGILEEFNLSRKDAEDLIMRARKKVFNI